MNAKQPTRTWIIAQYLGLATLIAIPGALFSARAAAMHFYRERKSEMGIIVFDVPNFPGMSINAYIQWMLVFSVPFWGFSLFVIYRLVVRVTRVPTERFK